MPKKIIHENILIEPVISEKSNVLREQNKYVFRVPLSANKVQVKEALRAMFKVNPISCNIMRVNGKPKRLRYRKGYTSSWKKAIVKLPKGETISLIEGV
jgi:large subunit ribosomal protein L23